MKESHLTFSAALIGLLTACVGLFTAISANNKSDEAKKISIRNESRINVIDSTLHIQNNVSGNDIPFTTPQAKNDTEISTFLEGRVPPAPPLPDGPDHINTFFQEPSSDGQRASSNKEAWVMAYIEKHQGEYSYQERKIYTFGDRNGKRDAIIKLVKEKGVDALFDRIAPIK